MKGHRIYLDYAAGAPVSSRARAAFVSASNAFGNPDAPHTEGRAAKDILEGARERIARLIGVKTEAVVFSGGATEANNLVILGTGKPGSHAIIADGAHASLTEPFKELARRGMNVDTLPYKEGRLDREALARLVRPETTLVSLERVAPETGVMNDTREVRRVLDKAGASRTLLHVDASQSPRIDAVDRTHLGADFLVLDAQKIGGVRGIGALIHSPRASLSSQYFGGGQEKGIRPGTPAPALAEAFAVALSDAQENRAAFLSRASALRARLIRSLPDAAVVNEGREQAPHIVNISLPGTDTDFLAALLDKAGIAVSTRSACETDTAGSRGVYALTGDAGRASASLRISFGPETKQSHVDRCIRALRANTAFIDRHRL